MTLFFSVIIMMGILLFWLALFPSNIFNFWSWWENLKEKFELMSFILVLMILICQLMQKRIFVEWLSWFMSGFLFIKIIFKHFSNFSVFTYDLTVFNQSIFFNFTFFEKIAKAKTYCCLQPFVAYKILKVRGCSFS